MASFGDATRSWFSANFSAPTRVQAEGWPHLALGKHALLVAPTGSGKTLAAFLSALDRCMHRTAPLPGYSVVYVSPLKALVYDIERNLRVPLEGIQQEAKRLGIAEGLVPRVDIRTGDTDQKTRRIQLKKPGDILVTTPESLYLLLGSQARENLRYVDTVIVDEIHAVAGTKRGVHLALSLERLARGARGDIQRIGLSATVSPKDEAASYLGGDRPVAIVDCAESPKIEIDVRMPPEVESQSPNQGAEDSVPLSRSIWPAIYADLVDKIKSHNSTIVFVNSRGLCERLAKQLQEHLGEDAVRAHHGSVAHDKRREMEEALKNGELQSIVATSSLELGIDMGTVDQVLLVASPGSVASGLQRLGRAGHQVGGVSRGVLYPKFKSDLLECVVISQKMGRGEVESLRVPTLALDVLAQQIVAMCVFEDWSPQNLLKELRRAYPYRDLSKAALESVLDMLTGHYPSDDFSDLRPRLNWDRTENVLSARKGSRMVSILNGGTIPDRGLYTVHAGPGGPRVGELDEEMVFETQAGERIVLGASTWQVTEITRDKVIVAPAPGEPGRLPFWHGDGRGRAFDLGVAMGTWMREIVEREDTARDWVQAQIQVDDHTADKLIQFVQEQQEHTKVTLSERAIVLERFRDEVGDWRVCLLSPFGSRVHAPWALAIQTILGRRQGFEVQAMYADDGIVVRMADTDTVPDLSSFLPSADEVEELITEELGNSALFASLFRENAARALLLTRRRPDRRQPLWQQRLKAKQLLGAVRKFPSFPIVLETYRHALQDYFDLSNLKRVLSDIETQSIKVHSVETVSPSPFAQSLAFSYVANYLYELDAPAAERRAQALSLDRGLLRELLGQVEMRDLLDADTVATVEQELQRLHPDYLATSPDDVHDMLRRLGDLTDDEIQARCASYDDAWLPDLERQQRVVAVSVAGESRFVAAEDAARYRDGLGVTLPSGLSDAFLGSVENAFAGLVLRFAKTRGPFRPEDVVQRYEVPVEQVVDVLEHFVESDEIVRGALDPSSQGEDWCAAEVLRRLKRRTMAKLRREVAPVQAAQYARFLIGWHGIGSEATGRHRLLEVIGQLQGVALPWSSWVHSILPGRVGNFNLDELDLLAATGAVVWVGAGPLGNKDGKVRIVLREQAALLLDEETPSPEDAQTDELLAFLAQRGSAFLSDMVLELGDRFGRQDDLLDALWKLVWAGKVTNDTFMPLRTLGAKRRGCAGRELPGRWSLVSQVTRSGASPTECVHAQVDVMLQRYGILSRDAVAREGFVGGFSRAYPLLLALDDAGRVQRGHFVEGFSGAQFALMGAVDRLRGASGDAVIWLEAIDPANPYGSVVSWPRDPSNSAPRFRRTAGTWVGLLGGALVMVWSASQASLWVDGDVGSDGVVTLLRELRTVTRRARLHCTVETVGDAPARNSALSAALKEAGFVEDYKRFLSP